MTIDTRIAAFRAGDEAAFEFVQSGEQPEAILAGFARGFTTAAEYALERAITEAKVPHPLRPAFAVGFRHGLPMAASGHLAGLASARGREGDEAAHLRMDATWRMHARTAEAALAVEDARDAVLRSLRAWAAAEAAVALLSGPRIGQTALSYDELVTLNEDDVFSACVESVLAAAKRKPALLELLSQFVASEQRDDVARARDAIDAMVSEALDEGQLALPTVDE